MVALVAVAVVYCGQDPEPWAMDLVDPVHALGWDTAPWLAVRGNCYNADESARPAPGWRVPAGRYILTLVDTTVRRPSKRYVRGRMWLARTRAGDSSRVTGEKLSADDSREHPLVGATDFPFDSLGIMLGDSASGIPAQNSFDPLRAGILVLHRNFNRSGVDPNISLLIGTRENIRGALLRDSAGVTLDIRGGGGDGFWGMWGLRSGGTARRGFFCAGWIDAR